MSAARRGRIGGDARVGGEELAERRCVDHFEAAAMAALDMIERTSTKEKALSDDQGKRIAFVLC